MLPKKNRISKEDFPAQKMHGLRFSPSLFSGVVYKNETDVRVSVVVSKKTAKTAVVRNRIRRRVYNAIRPYIKLFLFPVLIVFYPKKDTSTVEFNVLKVEIETFLHKAKLL